MKEIILIFFALFFFTKTNAESCESVFGGPLVQKVTHKAHCVNGLFWSSNRLLYVDETDPHVCRLSTNGTNNCTKLEGIKKVISVYPVKNKPHELIIYTNKTEKLLFSNTTLDGLPTGHITMKTTRVITKKPYIHFAHSVTDNKGRTIIAGNIKLPERTDSTVYLIDDNGETVIIPEGQIRQISGIALSSDQKSLFIAGSANNVIYKYEYNDGKITDAKREVVFNKTKHEEYHGYISAIALTKNNELWISTSNSGVINLYDWKNKRFLQNVKIPAWHPTSMCYGGEKFDVLFVGTKQSIGMEAKVDQGGGAVYAISGTGTEGFAQHELHEPKNKPAPKGQFKNAYYMGPEELEKMAVLDESLVTV